MRYGYLACAVDMLNVQDLDLIAQARSHCDVLTVGVLTNDDVLLCTGRAPVMEVEERLVLASHLRGVDHAVIHHEAEFALMADSMVIMAVRGESDRLRPDADVVLTPEVFSESTALRSALGRTA